MHAYHDRGIRKIKAPKDHRCYGMGLGIIILDDVYPGFPGDVRNASAYPFSIQYEIAEGVDIKTLVVEEDKSPCSAGGHFWITPSALPSTGTTMGMCDGQS